MTDADGTVGSGDDPAADDGSAAAADVPDPAAGSRRDLAALDATPAAGRNDRRRDRVTVRTRAFELPLAHPLATADGVIESREGVLVRFETADAAGLGEATPLAGWTESLDDCRLALVRAGNRLRSGTPVRAALPDAAAAPAARHALALALADLRAREHGVPLYRHLGSARRVASVPVNATVGDGDAETTASRATAAVERGFRCLKLKCGARPVEADLDRVRAVRAAVEDRTALRVDANGAWTRAEASAAVAGLADLNVAYVEQPLPAADLAGHAALRGRGVRIAVDESLSEYPIGAVLAADAADVAICKPMAMGGPDRAYRVATAVRRAGVTPIVTTTIDAVVARVGAVHLAAALPDRFAHGLATGQWLADDLGDDPAGVADGRTTVPQADGLGVESAWEAVE